MTGTRLGLIRSFENFNYVSRVSLGRGDFPRDFPGAYAAYTCMKRATAPGALAKLSADAKMRVIN